MSQTEAPVQALVPRKTKGRSPLRVMIQVRGEQLGIVLIVLGILGLVQPWVQDFFTNGFMVLLVGTILFIITSHL